MRATSEFQLGERGLEVFYNLGGDHVGIGKVRAVFERFVFEPEDVEVELVTLQQFFVGEAFEALLARLRHSEQNGDFVIALLKSELAINAVNNA